MSAKTSESVSSPQTRTPSCSVPTPARMARALVVLALVAGCATPPKPVVPAAQEATPAAVISPAPSPVDREGAKPGLNMNASPEDKPLPEPAGIVEDNNVFFEQNSVLVAERDKEKLRQHALRLKQNPKTYVTLTGYADDLGSRNYKLAIAEERLVAVSKLLKTYGVSPRQIRRNRSASVKNSPACSASDCQRLKRRVELVYPN